MNPDKTSSWLGVIANFGVIAGIIFLAVELRQTNELMESERRYNRLQIILNGNLPYLDNPELIEARRKADTDEELSENEESALTIQLNRTFSAWQWTWVELYGTDEFPLAQYQYAMQRSSFLQETWEARKPFLLPKFVKFVDENIVPR